MNVLTSRFVNFIVKKNLSSLASKNVSIKNSTALAYKLVGLSELSSSFESELVIAGVVTVLGRLRLLIVRTELMYGPWLARPSVRPESTCLHRMHGGRLEREEESWSAHRGRG